MRNRLLWAAVGGGLAAGTAAGCDDGAMLAPTEEPRCGNPDADPALRDPQQKFRLNPYAWPATTTSMTYGFTTPFTTAQKNAVKAALDTWAAVTNRSFSENTSNPSAALIKFKFGPIPTQCPSNSSACAVTPYDLLTNTIMEATVTYNPGWVFVLTNPPPQGQLDLQSVSLHEIGHALGLDHSNLPLAAMNPGPNHVRALTVDDAQAISLRYSPWETLPGSAWEIAVTADDNFVYKLGTATRAGGYEVSQWNEATRTWSLAMNSGATHIAAGNDYELWYTRDNNTVWHLEEDGAFQVSPSPVSPIADIGWGAGRLWVLAGAWSSTCGRTPYRWTGTSWQNMGAGGCGWKMSVDAAGNAWVVTSQGAVKRYSGSGTTWNSAGSGNGIASDIGIVPQLNNTGIGAWITSFMTEDANVPVKAWDEQAGGWVTPRYGTSGAYVAAGRFGQPWVLDVWQGQISRQRRD